MQTYPDVKLFINGEWRDAIAGETIEVTDPATDEVIGKIAHARKADLDLALEAADKGFKIWRDTAPFDRSKMMRKAADLLRERADSIAFMMTREQGKPLAQSKMEIMGAADTIDWFAEEARRTYGQIIPARFSGVNQMTIKLPFGPIAIVNRFSTSEEAITEANRLPFGLASYAFTGSVKTAHALGREVEAGMLTINHNGLALPEVPFGGVKDSGYGTEGGSEAVAAYLETKYVSQMN